MAPQERNEYLDSQRAQTDENDLFSAIGKQVLGLQSGDSESNQADQDDRVQLVDEIESLCMNCHDNVSASIRVVSASDTYWL